LIIEKIIVKEDLYEYSMKNISRTKKFFKHQVGKNFAVLDIFFMGYLERPPLHNCFSNIKVDI
jgi:hypothetical protein